jgi:hypothetical protein
LSFRCHRVDLQTVCPFDLRILAVKAEPTSVAGSKYHPKVNLTSGNVGTLSLNITQSYQPNSHMWLMSAVLPVIMVSGTLSLVIYTVLLVDEWINASSLIQWSQSTLGELVLSFYGTPLVSVHGYNPQRPAATGSRVQSVLHGNLPCKVSS